MKNSINTFLESSNLILEPLEEKHLHKEYISWLNDKEVTKFNSHGIYPNSIKKAKNYINTIQFEKSSIVLAMINKTNSKHIGNVSISNIDYINSKAEISIMIGNKNYWGKGYAAESFSLLIDHCFNQLNLHKVTAGTTSDNISMQSVCTKVGMIKEAILKEHIQRNGNFYDVYLYGIINK